MKKTDNVIENLRIYLHDHIVENTLIFRRFFGKFHLSISNPVTSKSE